jgi:hypothetical protein
MFIFWSSGSTVFEFWQRAPKTTAFFQSSSLPERPDSARASRANCVLDRSGRCFDP